MQSSFIGIDVSKAFCDISVHEDTCHWRFARDEDGRTLLREKICSLNPALVVLEATGGMEMVVAATLALVGVPVAIVNARQVRDFARAGMKLFHPMWTLGKDGRYRCFRFSALRLRRPPSGSRTTE